MLLANVVVKGAANLFPKSNSIGLTKALSATLVPILAVVLTTGANPYLYPSWVNLPTIGKPPPTIAPSAPYLILFLNSAAAFFLPVKPSVFSGFTNKESLPGSDAKKSVTPINAKPSADLVATWLIFLALPPLTALAAFFILTTAGILLKIFCTPTPGVPYWTNKDVRSPLHVSGLSGSFSSINFSKSDNKSVLAIKSVPVNNREPIPWAKSYRPPSIPFAISSKPEI